MFDIGWSELLVIGVVALIAIGPKELPGVLRSLGHWMGKVRRMATDFQDQFREAMREAEVADLKRQFDEASAKATSAFNNPLDMAQKEVEAAFGTEPGVSDKPAETASASTDAPVAEAAPSVVADAPMVAADGTIEIKPDTAKPGEGGAA
jgi:sec-independent protein translocase protein TatB